MEEVCWNNNRWSAINDREDKWTGGTCSKKLEEEGVEEAIALHCIIHQQVLCSKCLKFDNVMSMVVKCINQIRSRGLKHRRFRAFLEEMESEDGDVLDFTEVRWLSRGNVLKRF